MSAVRVLLLDPGRVLGDVPKRTAFARRALDEADAKTVLFTQAGVLRAFPEMRDWFEQVFEFENFRTNCEVELAAARLHRENPFQHILAYREVDIIRAARMRKALGVGGQDELSAAVFRDKLLMKEAAVAAGVPVLPFHNIGSIWDLLDFGGKTGFPFVVKPRLEYGMLGLTGILERSALEPAVKKLFTQHSEYPQFYIAESFCRARLAHVDGIWKEGRFLCVCASLYTGPGPLDGSMPDDEFPAGSVMLPPGDPLAASLCSLTERILAAFPAPPVTAFHAEVWVMDDGSLALNEIASRPGGMYIYDMLSEVFGVPLETALTKELLGLASGMPLHPLKLSQNFRVPVRPGRVNAVPRACPLPWVRFYYPECAAGDLLAPPGAWYESMASLVTLASTAEGLAAQRREAIAWFRAETVMSEK